MCVPNNRQVTPQQLKTATAYCTRRCRPVYCWCLADLPTIVATSNCSMHDAASGHSNLALCQRRKPSLAVFGVRSSCIGVRGATKFMGRKELVTELIMVTTENRIPIDQDGGHSTSQAQQSSPVVPLEKTSSLLYVVDNTGT